jgi:hypothetical protein
MKERYTMDFLKYRVKVLENFKDGNIMEGRELRVNEILTISQTDFVKVTNSGGKLEILEEMIPNPRKAESEEAVAAKQAVEDQKALEQKAKQGERKQAEEVTFRQEAEEKKQDLATGDNSITAPHREGAPAKKGRGTVRK